jgi:hypothetical protein
MPVMIWQSNERPWTMNTLLMSLVGLSVLCICYGIIKIALVVRESGQKRSAFEHRAQGRRSDHRSLDRRTKTEGYPQV